MSGEFAPLPAEVMRAAARPRFMVVLSAACPAKCSYCFGPHRGPSMSTTTLQLVLDLIDRVASDTNAGPVDVTFHGGEPLLASHEIWASAVSGLRSRLGTRLKTGVQSNLWRLDDWFCELFAAHRMAVGTSLDGPRWITDGQRGHGYFDRTMRGIDRARGHGLEVSCIATSTTSSAEHWDQVLGFFASTGLDVALHPAIPVLGRPKGDWCVSPEAYAEMLTSALAWYTSHLRELRVADLDRACRAVATGRPQVCTFHECLGEFLAIDADGGIYPCTRFCGHDYYRLGTVHTRPTLAELLRSRSARRLHRRQERVRQVCGECPHFGYCHGGCPYATWAHDPAGFRDPFCQAYRALWAAAQQRLVAEASAGANLAVAAARSPAECGHPLLRIGPLTNVLQPATHPRQKAENARWLLAGAALGQPNPDVRAVAGLRPQIRARLAASVGRVEQLVVWLARAADAQIEARRGPSPVLPVALLQALAADVHRADLVLAGRAASHPHLAEVLAAVSVGRERGAWRRVTLRLAARDLDELPLWSADIERAVDRLEIHLPSSRGACLWPGDWAASRLTSCLAKRAVLVHALQPPTTRQALRGWIECAGQMGLPLRRVVVCGHVSPADVVDYPECAAARPLLGPRHWLRRGPVLRATCGLGRGVLVDARGAVFACPQLAQDGWRLGALPGDKVGSLTNVPPWSELSEWTIDTGPCRRCPERYLCGGCCMGPWLAEGIVLPRQDQSVGSCPMHATWDAVLRHAETYLRRDAGKDAGLTAEAWPGAG